MADEVSHDVLQEHISKNFQRHVQKGVFYVTRYSAGTVKHRVEILEPSQLFMCCLVEQDTFLS